MLRRISLLREFGGHGVRKRVYVSFGIRCYVEAVL